MSRSKSKSKPNTKKKWQLRKRQILQQRDQGENKRIRYQVGRGEEVKEGGAAGDGGDGGKGKAEIGGSVRGGLGLATEGIGECDGCGSRKPLQQSSHLRF